MLSRRSELSGKSSPRLVRHVGEFAEHVESRLFPCMFATRELLADRVLFGLVEHPDPALDGALAAVREAVAHIKKDLTEVVVIFLENPLLRRLEDDVELASSVLRSLLHEVGGEWPTAAPVDPADPLWTLWVDGVDLFINFNSPHHVRRRSRNLGSAFTMVLQSRQSFDQFAGDDGVRSLIRARVARYDDVPPHPALGSYGDPSNREALQYFLGDGGDAVELLPFGSVGPRSQCQRRESGES